MGHLQGDVGMREFGMIFSDIFFLATTYRALIRSLTCSGYTHHQYSDQKNMLTFGMGTYIVMVNLCFALPDSKLATTIKSLKMHYIDNLLIMDATHTIRLGGWYEPGLHINVPTPRNLVNQALGIVGVHLFPFPVQVQVGVLVLPQHARPFHNALNLANWYTGCVWSW
jgi:hypothetical protein